MRRFAQQTELLTLARAHVENRVNSLEKDVRHCLQGEPDPFPAILYCFSTIDLLGAFVSVRADRKAPTTQQSIRYMTSFLSYTTENANLLLNLFRHKLVHLAQPNPVIRRDSELVTWRYHHNKVVSFEEDSTSSEYTNTCNGRYRLQIVVDVLALNTV